MATRFLVSLGAGNVSQDTWALQAAVRDVKACPVALLVAAGIMLLYEVKFSNSLRALGHGRTEKELMCQDRKQAETSHFGDGHRSNPLASGTNLDYEEHFHRMSLYQREVLDNLKMIKDVLDGLWWPVRETVQMCLGCPPFIASCGFKRGCSAVSLIGPHVHVSLSCCMCCVSLQL